MKAEITEDGVHIYAEDHAERWALQAIFPLGADHAEVARRIVIHGDPKDSQKFREAGDEGLAN